MKLLRIGSIALLAVVSTVAVSAQVSNISDKEFDAAMNLAFSKSNEKNRREVTREEVFENGKISQSSVITEEFMMPDGTRWSSDTVFLGEKRHDEFITIGQKRYEKSALGEWFVKADIEQVVDRGGRALTPEEFALMKFTSQPGKLNGRKVRILTRVERSAADAIPETTTFTLYIAADGTIAKREQRTIAEYGKRDHTTEITTYQYDPKIKIEAPIK